MTRPAARRRRIRTGAAAALLAGLAGCSVGGSVSRNADGSYQASCGGPFTTKLDCDIAAQQQCGGPFSPISSPTGALVFSCGPAKPSADPTVRPLAPL